jgi:hypothetical protein
LPFGKTVKGKLVTATTDYSTVQTTATVPLLSAPVNDAPMCTDFSRFSQCHQQAYTSTPSFLESWYMYGTIQIQQMMTARAYIQTIAVDYV